MDDDPVKIGALIPVRLASERLPGKALMDLAGGRDDGEDDQAAASPAVPHAERG